jgi:type II secretory pathway pseudopilin PulG
MTMVEVMVALLVLGIVLSGFATVILSSMRAIVKNEREVRATSLAQQAIEELQAIEWHATGIYEDEATSAGATWASHLAEILDDTNGEPAYLSGDASEAERLPQVPEPVRGYTQANVDYTVFTFVTWLDSDGDGTADTKKFTAIVTWPDAAGHERMIRAEGTRVPTQSEAPATSAGLRVLAFTASPDPAQLNSTGHNVDALKVTVRTNLPVQPTTPTPEIRYYTLGDDVDDNVPVLRTRTLTGSDGNTIWSTTIPANHHRWTNGFVDVLFVGRDTAGNLLEAWGSVEFRGGPLDGPAPKPPSSNDSGSFPYPTPAEPEPEPDPDAEYPSEPVKVGSVSPEGTICVNNSNWALRSNYKVTIKVSGMRTIDNVIVRFDSYSAKNGALVRTSQDAAYVSGSETNATFEALIPAGQRYFAPGSSVRFEAKASRSDGFNDTLESGPASVSASC